MNQPTIIDSPEALTPTQTASPMARNITVVRSESGTMHDLAIMPGTTSRDVLREIGLDDNYVLSSGRGSAPFGPEENIYGSVSNGAKLFAATPVEVGQ